MKKILLISIAMLANLQIAKTQAPSLEPKIRGMLFGTLIGDALGGPIEFQGSEWVQQTPNPPKKWLPGEKMTLAEADSATKRIHLRSYKHLLPDPQPYGTWQPNAEPGSITDDSRNKIVLMRCLRNQWKNQDKTLTANDLATAYLNFQNSKTVKSRPAYDALCQDWLAEIKKSIRWMQGSRTPGQAAPPERMWNALPTCWGQMTALPLAAIYPGDTLRAYHLAYQLAFYDNGFAKDMNAAIVAGLAKALTLDPTQKSNTELWTEVIETMKNTDPYRYSEVPWCQRGITKWLVLADTFVERSGGEPAKLWQELENVFYFNEKWEAQVPVAVCFSALKICNYDPLAALQLSIEWGWDTDTYPQLLGAFVGAIYGEEIFKNEWKSLVSKQLQADYDERLEEWAEVLLRWQRFSRGKNVFR